MKLTTGPFADPVRLPQFRPVFFPFFHWMHQRLQLRYGGGCSENSWCSQPKGPPPVNCHFLKQLASAKRDVTFSGGMKHTEEKIEPSVRAPSSPPLRRPGGGWIFGRTPSVSKGLNSGKAILVAKSEDLFALLCSIYVENFILRCFPLPMFLSFSFIPPRRMISCVCALPMVFVCWIISPLRFNFAFVLARRRYLHPSL